MATNERTDGHPGTAATQRRLVFGALMLVLLMAALDQTIASTCRSSRATARRIRAC